MCSKNYVPSNGRCCWDITQQDTGSNPVVVPKKEKEYDRTTISTEYSRRNTERRPMDTRTMRHLQRASTRTAHETNTYPKHQIQINICEEP